jgi:RNA polymerase sigma factor (sigma-70 family)
LLAACRRMGPEARAEDVLQQALMSAWAALARGDEVRELRAWLFQIARNAAVSDLRRTAREPPELLGTLIVAPSLEEEAGRRAVVQETLETLASLPPRQREALLQIAVQGRSQDEVAAELGVSRVAVRQLVHRARTAMRAGASAVVPMPVVAWLAGGAGDGPPMASRIGELVAGAGGATLVKSGIVVGVAATTMVAAPPVREHPLRHHAPVVAKATPKPAHAAVRRRRPVRVQASATPTATVAAVRAVVTAAPTAAPRVAAPRRTAAPAPAPRRTPVQHRGERGDDDETAPAPQLATPTPTPSPAEAEHEDESAPAVQARDDDGDGGEPGEHDGGEHGYDD